MKSPLLKQARSVTRNDDAAMMDPALSANLFERSFAHAAIGKALVGLDGR